MARRRRRRRTDSARSRTRFRANRSLVSTPIPRSLPPSSQEVSLTRPCHAVLRDRTVLGISSCPPAVERAAESAPTREIARSTFTRTNVDREKY